MKSLPSIWKQANVTPVFKNKGADKILVITGQFQ